MISTEIIKPKENGAFSKLRILIPANPEFHFGKIYPLKMNDMGSGGVA